MEENKHSFLLRETKEIQAETKETLDRIRLQAAETEELGKMALTSLNGQDEQLDTILDTTGKMHHTLKETDKLQNKFSRWALRFGNRRRARKTQKKEEKLQRYVKQTKKEKVRAETKREKNVLKNDNERNILFGQQVNKSDSKKLSTNNNTHRGAETQLSREDKEALEDIENTEKDLIDPALDALGEQVEGLLSLSLSIGEATKKQNHKLNQSGGKVDNVNKRVDLASRRITLAKK